MTHPLPGVPLTFLFAFHTEIHGKSLLLSNANANENANANAKVSRHLFWQQYRHPCTHAPMHPCTPPFFLFGWVGRCCASSSDRGPLDITVCISYGDPWKISITFVMLMLMKMLMLMPKCRVIYSGNSIGTHAPMHPCTPPFFFLVGWVGAVPHPLQGVPLTFLSAFHTEIHGKL